MYINKFNIFIIEKIKIFLEISNYNFLEIIDKKIFFKKIFLKIILKKKINIKIGFDPSKKYIHLGHLILLYKIIQYNKLNLNIIIIIGNFTVLINEIKNKKNLNIKLFKFLIINNIKFYLYQLKFILNLKKIKIFYNNEWLDFLELKNIIYFISILKFKNLYKIYNNKNIINLIYSIIQSYDSIFLKTNFEIGGKDQRINFLITVYMQKFFKIFIQFFNLSFLLKDLKNYKKMSKSRNNFISLNYNINKNFENFLKIKDSLIKIYFKFLSFNNKKIFLKKIFLRGKIKFFYKKKLIYELIKRFFNIKNSNFFFKNYLKNINKKINNIIISKNFFKIKNHYIILYIFIINLFKISRNKFNFYINQKMIKINNINIYNLNFILFKGIYIINFLKKIFYIYIKN